VIFSEGLAKVAEQYLHKGSKVYLEGQLQTRKWQDQSGQDKYSTEVVLQGFNSALTMLDGRGDNAEGSGTGFSGPREYGNSPPRTVAAAAGPPQMHRHSSRAGWTTTFHSEPGTSPAKQRAAESRPYCVL